MKNTTTTTPNTLTAMQRVLAQAARAAAQTPGNRQTKTPKPCTGGCGEMTRGGNWFPGHDGRVSGRAIQLMRLGATAEETARVVSCREGWDAAIEWAAILDGRIADATGGGSATPEEARASMAVADAARRK